MIIFVQRVNHSFRDIAVPRHNLLSKNHHIKPNLINLCLQFCCYVLKFRNIFVFDDTFGADDEQGEGLKDKLESFSISWMIQHLSGGQMWNTMNRLDSCFVRKESFATSLKVRLKQTCPPPVCRAVWQLARAMCSEVRGGRHKRTFDFTHKSYKNATKTFIQQKR